MRKLLFALAIIAVLLAPVALAASSKPREPLEKVTFIHYKKDFARPDNAKVSPTPVCYKLLGPKWKSLPVGYVVNPNGYDAGFVTNAISAAVTEWDSYTSVPLFNGYVVDSSATWDDTVEQVDYNNEYVFGSYPDSNVIAVTVVWYTRVSRQIVDYDVLFNTNYDWKDCSVAGTDCSMAMDLQNIATHETGHGIGLADVYSTSCSAVTMFGYSSYGETQKRTLETADIAGLQKLYGV